MINIASLCAMNILSPCWSIPFIFWHFLHNSEMYGTLTIHVLPLAICIALGEALLRDYKFMVVCFHS